MHIGLFIVAGLLIAITILAGICNVHEDKYMNDKSETAVTASGTIIMQWENDYKNLN